MLRFAVFALVLAGLAGCSRQSAVTPSMEDVYAEGAPTQESWDVRYAVFESPLGQEDSRPRMELHAAHMAAYEQGDSAFTVLRGLPEADPRVTAYLFDPQGDTSAVVRADRIIYHDRDRRFEARGDVVVETTADKRLESEVLFWREDERKVRTPGFTRLVTPTESIQGYGFVADENLDFYTLARVTGTGRVEE